MSSQDDDVNHVLTDTPGLPEMTDAALRLAKVLLQRAASHRTGYGYVQTWDAAKLGLIDGNFDRWKLTPLGQALLNLEFDNSQEGTK
jgi:hypothetical protein